MFVTWVNLLCERCKNMSAHEYYHSYWYGRTTKCTICKHVVLHTCTPDEVKIQLQKELVEKSSLPIITDDIELQTNKDKEVVAKKSVWKQVQPST